MDTDQEKQRILAAFAPVFHAGITNALEEQLKALVTRNLDLAGKGKYTKSLVHLEELARTNGLHALGDDFAVIKSFLMQGQLDKQFRMQEMVRNRTYPERHLEDFLEPRLTCIEPGLTLQGRQYTINAGILDLFAKDPQDKDVIIELKMNTYAAKGVRSQIEKYLYDQPTARLIFVAPYISSDLFSSLRRFVDAGRLTFKTVKRIGKEYVITHVPNDGSTIPPPKKHNGSTRSQSTSAESEDGVVTLYTLPNKKPTTHGKKKTGTTETPVATKSFIDGEDIPKETFHAAAERESVVSVSDDAVTDHIMADLTSLSRKGYDIKKLPHHLQVIAASNVAFPGEPHRSLEHYMRPRPITAAQRKTLEQLIDPASLRTAREECKRTNPQKFRHFMDRYGDDADAIALHIEKAHKTLQANLHGYHELDALMCEFSKSIKTLQDPQTPEELTAHNKKCILVAMHHLKETNAILVDKKTVQDLERFHHIARRDEDNEQLYATDAPPEQARNNGLVVTALDAYSGICNIYYIRYIAESTLLHANRTMALEKIDPYLAWAYHAESSRINGTGPTTDCFQMTDEKTAFYKALLTLLPAETAPEKTPARTTTPGPVIQKLVARAQDTNRNSPLYAAVTGGKSVEHVYSEDTDTRIVHFVEDTREILSGRQVKQAAAAFETWKLSHKMRRREERPSDLKLRNFFDDITLKYIRHGQVPDERQLEAAYQNA